MKKKLATIIAYTIVFFLFAIYFYPNLFPLLFILQLSFNYNRNQKHKKVQKIQLLYSLEELSFSDIVKKRSVPNWLLYPDLERARTLNKILSFLWDPNLKKALENKIKSKLDIFLERKRPNFFNKLSCINIDLGVNPPMFSSFKVYDNKMYKTNIANHNSNHVYIDVLALLNSPEAKIEFTLEYKKIHTVISIFEIFASLNFRIKLCDFVDVFPGFSRLDVSLINYPDINFSLSAGFITLSNFPGLSQWLDKFVKYDLFEEIVYPKYHTILVSNDSIEELRATGGLVIYKQLLRHTEGIIRVKLNKIILKSMIKYASNNFYCLLSISNNKTLKKTKVVKAYKNVITINKSVLFHTINISKDEDSKFLKILVFNESICVDQFVAQKSICLNILLTMDDFKGDFINQEIKNIKTVGEINMSIQYIPPTIKNVENRKGNNKIKSVLPNIKKYIDKISEKKILKVSIIEAKNLPVGIKAFSVVEVESITLQTHTISGTIWNESFLFEIMNKTKKFKVTLWDANTVNKSYLGQVIIQLKDCESYISNNFNNDGGKWYTIINKSDGKQLVENGQIKIDFILIKKKKEVGDNFESLQGERTVTKLDEINHGGSKEEINDSIELNNDISEQKLCNNRFKEISLSSRSKRKKFNDKIKTAKNKFTRWVKNIGNE